MIRGASLLAVVLALCTAPAPVVSPWDWPLTPGFGFESGETGPGWVYRLVPLDPAEGRLRPVTDGSLLFSASADKPSAPRTSAIPRRTSMRVFSHENDFVSTYVFEENASNMDDYMDESDNVTWVEFALWDGRRRSQINPRMVLAHLEEPLSTQIPAVLFLRDGIAIPRDALVAGPFTVAIDTDAVLRALLPWEVRLIRGGSQLGHHRFVAAAHLEPSLVELGTVEAVPGWNAIVVEALHFDRTVTRRTVRFFAAAPPPEPEDTPPQTLGSRP